MRALVVGWIGVRHEKPEFIDHANERGDHLLKLFEGDGYNTLGKYNSPRYYGMDTWALVANIAYLGTRMGSHDHKLRVRSHRAIN
jgi:hypothetical protein